MAQTSLQRTVKAAAAATLWACCSTSAYAQAAEKPAYGKLDSILNQLADDRGVARPTTGVASARPSFAQLGLVEYGSGRVGVTIRFRGDGQAIRDFVMSRNGHIAYTFDGAIEAYLDPAALPDLNALDDTDRVEAIVRPEPQVLGQGVSAHNAVLWQAAGFSGQGVKIGIIDVGFLGWPSLSAADAPSLAAARCYVGGGFYTASFSDCQTASAHGTAVAEAAQDIAPGATFYVARVDTKGDLTAAVQWMVQQGVRVVNISMSFAWDGPGDGTSPNPDSPLRAVDAAVAGGALVSISSGNYGQSSWFGSWQDPDLDNYLQLTSSTERTCVHLPLGQTMTVQLRWQDTWGGSTRDLDLELWHLATNTTVASGIDFQNGGAAHVPFELATYTAGTAGTYCASVRRYAGAVPAWVQLATRQSTLELGTITKAGSVSSPAETANSGALAVGAANWQSTSTIEAFSSQGPTPDGRVKPDIVGVDRADSFTYGPNGFPGTSQSAPHVAGLAALVIQGYPSDTPAQVATKLKTWALARGGAVPNNTWGAGLAYLRSVYNLTVSRAGSGAGTVTSSDSRVNCGTACTVTYFSGTAVTMTAVAAAGSVFAGWSGGSCSGVGPCAVTVTAASQVTATFNTISASQQFPATLTGAQQVPAVSSSATGSGAVALNSAENQITVNMSFSGLTSAVTAAHIHGSAAAGSNAGVLFDFSGVTPAATSGTIPVQTFAITPAQAVDLKAGLFYFNIHTGNFGGGEIRGQISGVTAPGAFTDDPLVAGSTMIRSVHITELRTRINALRSRYGLSAFAWTDETLSGVFIRAIHITELRGALSAVYAAAGITAPVFTDSPLVAGIAMKVVHIAELRSAVIAIE